MNNEKQWIEEMRKRMEDYSEPLPEGLWEEIEQELAVPKIIPFKKIWQAAAVILVVLASSLTAWFWSSPAADFAVRQENVPEIAAMTESSLETQQPPATVQLTSEKGRELQAYLPDKAPDRPTPISTYSLETADNAAVPKNDHSEDIRHDTGDKETAETESQEKKFITTSRAQKANRTADRRQIQENAKTLQLNEKERKFSFGIHSGNTPYSSTNNYGGMGRLAIQSSPDIMELTGTLNDTEMAYSQVLFENRELAPATRINHHIPVTIGATFRWEFVKDWSLETGIMYTLLVSELYSGENAYVEEEQRLHYVGIPLKIQRSIWKGNRFCVYASGGGAVEKCVSGKIKTKYVSAYGRENTEKNSIDIKQLQWSVTAGVGAQMNITPQVGLYVEPGVAYYFDDNSPIETIRKEHPLNFNLQLGLRFSVDQ